MNIAKAYAMLMQAQGSARDRHDEVRTDASHGDAQWLASNIYRVVSQAGDLIDRLSARRTGG